MANGESPTKKGKTTKGKGKNGAIAAGDGSDDEESPVKNKIVKEEAAEDGEDA